MFLPARHPIKNYNTQWHILTPTTFNWKPQHQMTHSSSPCTPFNWKTYKTQSPIQSETHTTHKTKWHTFLPPHHSIRNHDTQCSSHCPSPRTPSNQVTYKTQSYVFFPLLHPITNLKKTHPSTPPSPSSSHTPSNQNPTKLKNPKPTDTCFFPTHNIQSKTQWNPVSHCSSQRAHHPIQSNQIKSTRQATNKKPKFCTFAELVALALDPRDNLALRHGGAQCWHENLSNLSVHHEPRAMPPAAARPPWGGNERGGVAEEGRRRRRGGVKTTHGGGGGCGGHRQLQGGRHGCNAIKCNTMQCQAKAKHSTGLSPSHPLEEACELALRHYWGTGDEGGVSNPCVVMCVGGRRREGVERRATWTKRGGGQSKGRPDGPAFVVVGWWERGWNCLSPNTHWLPPSRPSFTRIGDAS